MRNNGFFVFATCCLLVFSATSCQKIKGIFGKKKSSTTGWTYNDSKNGGIEYNNVKAQKTGPAGMGRMAEGTCAVMSYGTFGYSELISPFTEYDGCPVSGGRIAAARNTGNRSLLL